MLTIPGQGKLESFLSQGRAGIGTMDMLQVKMILNWFDSEFPLSSNPNYSYSMNKKS